MTVVVDASVVIAALIDPGPVGTWAEALLRLGSAAAPHLMPVDVSNVLRRSTRAGSVSEDVASLAHEDLVAMPVVLFPYSTCASRVWALRPNVTAYDAWYVALAEILTAPLATLDTRLSRAAGPRCEFLVPPSMR